MLNYIFSLPYALYVTHVPQLEQYEWIQLACETQFRMFRMYVMDRTGRKDG